MGLIYGVSVALLFSFLFFIFDARGRLKEIAANTAACRTTRKDDCSEIDERG